MRTLSILRVYPIPQISVVGDEAVQHCAGGATIETGNTVFIVVNLDDVFRCVAGWRVFSGKDS